MREPCWFCGGPFEYYGRVKGNLDYWRCRHCGLWYQPSARKERILDSDYFEKKPESVFAEDLAKQQADEILKRAEQLVPIKRVFELGPGCGYFAEKALAAGWEYLAYDAAPLAPTVIKGWAKQGDWETDEFPFREQFTFFVAIHVVEHFVEPVASFQKIADRTARGGLVFLHTPNGGNVYGKDWVHFWPEHIYLYSHYHLTAIMARHGVMCLSSEFTNSNDDIWWWGRKQ